MTTDDLKEAERFEKWLKGEKLDELIKEAEEKTNAFCKENKLIAGSEILRFGSAFERGYLASAEPREKRIAELEKKNKSLTEQVCNVANNLLDNWCKNEEDYCPHLAKLEKENAELDCQKNRNKFCYSCANATERCFRNEIGCPCEKYKSWKEENAELKEEWQEQVQKATDEGYARTLLQIENDKLKKQIEKMRNCGNCKYGYCGGSSISIDKNGNKTFHNWNKEKQEYCDIGKNGKYQCWELAE